MFVILRNNSVCRWVLLQPQISILLTLLIESISSFLVVMACGGYSISLCIHRHSFTHLAGFNLVFLSWTWCFGYVSGIWSQWCCWFCSEAIDSKYLFYFFPILQLKQRSVHTWNQDEDWRMRVRKKKKEYLLFMKSEWKKKEKILLSRVSPRLRSARPFYNWDACIIPKANKSLTKPLPNELATKVWYLGIWQHFNLRWIILMHFFLFKLNALL